MPGKMSPLLIVILALVVIGLVYQSLSSPIQLIIPVAVLAVIFLLYKFPPGGARASRTRPKNMPRREQQTKSKTRKNIPFRVIEGGKDDDNMPKYH